MTPPPLEATLGRSWRGVLRSGQREGQHSGPRAPLNLNGSISEPQRDGGDKKTVGTLKDPGLFILKWWHVS